ncbi:hypothetical protein ACFLZV_02740, partial [Candidatus Margulisiibacteriota bacterium]
FYNKYKDLLKTRLDNKEPWQGLILRAGCQFYMEETKHERRDILEKLINFVEQELNQVRSNAKIEEFTNVSVCFQAIIDLFHLTIKESPQVIPEGIVKLADCFEAILEKLERDMKNRRNTRITSQISSLRSRQKKSKLSLLNFKSNVSNNSDSEGVISYLPMSNKTNSSRLLSKFLKKHAIEINNYKLIWHKIKNRQAGEKIDQRRLRQKEERKILEKSAQYFVNEIFKVLMKYDSYQECPQVEIEKLAFSMRKLSIDYKELQRLAKETNIPEQWQLVSSINLIVAAFNKKFKACSYKRLNLAFEEIKLLAQNSKEKGSLGSITADLFLELTGPEFKISDNLVKKGISLVEAMLYKLEYKLRDLDKRLIIIGSDRLLEVMTKIKGVKLDNRLKKKFLDKVDQFLWKLMSTQIRLDPHFIEAVPGQDNKHDQLERLLIDLRLELNPEFKSKIDLSKSKLEEAELVEKIVYMLTRFMVIQQRAKRHPVIEYLDILSRKEPLKIEDFTEIRTSLSKNTVSIESYDREEIIRLVKNCDELFIRNKEFCNKILTDFHALSRPIKEYLRTISIVLATSKMWMALYEENKFKGFLKNLSSQNSKEFQKLFSILNIVNNTLTKFNQFGHLSCILNNGIDDLDKVKIIENSKNTYDTLQTLYQFLQIFQPVFMRAFGLAVLYSEANSALNKKEETGSKKKVKKKGPFLFKDKLKELSASLDPKYEELCTTTSYNLFYVFMKCATVGVTSLNEYTKHLRKYLHKLDHIHLMFGKQLKRDGTGAFVFPSPFNDIKVFKELGFSIETQIINDNPGDKGQPKKQSPSGLYSKVKVTVTPKYGKPYFNTFENVTEKEATNNALRFYQDELDKEKSILEFMKAFFKKQNISLQDLSPIDTFQGIGKYLSDNSNNLRLNLKNYLDKEKLILEKQLECIENMKKILKNANQKSNFAFKDRANL